MKMFEKMHPDWIPYKEREERAIALFEEGLSLLKENKKNYFGLVTGDQKFAIMCNMKNKDDEFKMSIIHLENEQTGKTVLGLWDLLQDVLERNGLVVAIYEGHDFYRGFDKTVKEDE